MDLFFFPLSEDIGVITVCSDSDEAKRGEVYSRLLPRVYLGFVPNGTGVRWPLPDAPCFLRTLTWTF